MLMKKTDMGASLILIILSIKCKKTHTIILTFSEQDRSQTQNKAQSLANCRHLSPSSQSLRFILSLRMNSSFITSRPGLCMTVQTILVVQLLLNCKYKEALAIRRIFSLVGMITKVYFSNSTNDFKIRLFG